MGALDKFIGFIRGTPRYRISIDRRGDGRYMAPRDTNRNEPRPVLGQRPVADGGRGAV